MAVLLKKKKALASAGWAAWSASLKSSKPLFPTVMMLVGLVSVSVGMLFVAEPPADTRLVAPVNAKGPATGEAPADPLKDDVSLMHAQTSRIVAALLAYKKLEGVLPEDLQALEPYYLAKGEGHAGVTGWKLVDFTLKKEGIKADLCKSINGGKVTPIDHGVVGLRCVSVNNVNTAVYRIDPAEPPKKGFLRIELAGSLDNKLSTWSVIGTPVAEAECEGPAEALERLELQGPVSSVSRTFCLLAYEQELEPIRRGLSLLEGGDVLEIQGMAMEEPWYLRLSAQACGFGSKVLAQVELGGKTPPVLVPAALSCDLKLLAK